MPYIGSTANIPPKWALCNGSNGTPNLTGRFLEGVTSASAAKQAKAAGLPNLTGNSPTPFTSSTVALFHASGGTGVFSTPYENAYREAVQDAVDDNYYNGATQRLHFDASKCNSIYGNSTTVQPNSYTVMYIMKIKA